MGAYHFVTFLSILFTTLTKGQMVTCRAGGDPTQRWQIQDPATGIFSRKYF